MENQTNIGDQNAQQIEQNTINQKVRVSEKPKANYWTISILLLVIILVVGSIFVFNSMNEKPQNNFVESIPASSSVDVTPSEPNVTKNGCVFKGAMQKLSYIKLSNIVSKNYCDSKYQSWTKVKNIPFTFQALIPSYYKHQPDYGGFTFDILHPVYGNFSIVSWGNDGGGEMKRGGWAEIEKNLCVGAETGHIPNNISAFEYFANDARSGNYYMARQEGNGVVVMSPIFGHYWGISITYQSKSEDTQGSSSFKERSLMRDPEFLCFLGSIDLVSTPPK